MDFHSDKDTWSPGNPIRYCWFFRDIEWFQQTDDVPVWAINLGAEIGGRWTALIEQNFSQNAARIFTKIRLIERNVPPTQQYLFLVDLLDWVGTSSDMYCYGHKLTRLVVSGFPKVLISILLNPRTYSAEYTHIINQSRFVGIILSLLAMLGAEAKNQILYIGCDCSEPRQCSPEFIHHILESTVIQLPLLCKLFWQRRSVFLTQPSMTVLKRPSNKESMGFITNVSVFGQVTVWGAVNEYEPVIFGDEWKNHFKVLFYLWIVTDAFRDMPEIRSRAARYMSDVMFPLSQDESQKAACDVARVTFNGDGSHQAIRTICHILAEEAMDHQLHYTWSITLLLLTATPANFFKSPVDIANNADLFHSTLQAMQRQVCCGTESNNKYNVLPVLVCIHLLMFRGMPHFEVARRNLGDVRLLPVLARNYMIPMLRQRSTPDEADRIAQLLESCVWLVTDELQLAPQGENIRKFKYSFRKVWYPTLQEMYSLGDHIRSSDAVRFWVMLGNLIGLSEEHESFAYPYFMRRVQDVFPRGQTKRCHWYACICAEDRHPPHSKRICTGCAQAYYCSFQCQRSDWEEGPHRDECASWMMEYNRQSESDTDL